MSPFIVLPVAIIVLIVGMYFLGIWCNVIPPVSAYRGLALFKREIDYFADPEEAAEINDVPTTGMQMWECEQTEKSLTGEIPKVAVGSFALAIPVEIGHREIGPMTFELADMTLRLTKPHLFSAEWYANSRQEFSLWAAEEWRKIGVRQNEMKEWAEEYPMRRLANAIES
jgi:hypothetical protein